VLSSLARPARPPVATLGLIAAAGLGSHRIPPSRPGRTSAGWRPRPPARFPAGSPRASLIFRARSRRRWGLPGAAVAGVEMSLFAIWLIPIARSVNVGVRMSNLPWPPLAGVAIVRSLAAFVWPAGRRAGGADRPLAGRPLPPRPVPPASRPAGRPRDSLPTWVPVAREAAESGQFL